MLATTSGETLNIISKTECEIEIEEFFKSLKHDISFLQNSPVIDEDKMVSKSISHSLFKYNQYSSKISSIRDIVFAAAIDCEKYIGGSADTFLLALKNTLSLHRGQRLKYAQDCLGSSMINVSNKKRISSSDLSKIINEYHPVTKSIIKEAISKCSPRTMLSLEKSSFIEDRVLEKNSLHFDIKPIPGFCAKDWLREDVNVLMIDGIIESVSQIHHFLTLAFESKEPFLLISRAYNPEVIKTIAENKARGLVDIMAIDLGFSMENHHFLNDVSRIFDIEYASPDFGDVISVFVRRGLKKIKKICVTNSGIDFFPEDYDRLEKVRKEVFELSLKNLGSEASELIEKRSKSLSSDRVIISVGKDSVAKNPVIIEELDIFIRRFKSLIRDGVVFTKVKDIDKVKKIYSSIEIPFVFNKISSVIRSIDSISCIIKKE